MYDILLSEILKMLFHSCLSCSTHECFILVSIRICYGKITICIFHVHHSLFNLWRSFAWTQMLLKACLWFSVYSLVFSPIFQLIGRTPLVFLNKVNEGCGAYIAVKQEMMQPTASIKDRCVWLLIIFLCINIKW